MSRKISAEEGRTIINNFRRVLPHNQVVAVRFPKNIIEEIIAAKDVENLKIYFGKHSDTEMESGIISNGTLTVVLEGIDGNNQAVTEMYDYGHVCDPSC